MIIFRFSDSKGKGHSFNPLSVLLWEIFAAFRSTIRYADSLQIFHLKWRLPAAFSASPFRSVSGMSLLCETGPFSATCEALDDPADHELLTELRRGSDTAAEQLYLRYAKRLLAIAEAKTGKDLSHRFDAEDVIQSVFRSFFERGETGCMTFQRGGTSGRCCWLSRSRRSAPTLHTTGRDVGTFAAR